MKKELGLSIVTKDNKLYQKSCEESRIKYKRGVGSWCANCTMFGVCEARKS